MSNQLQPGYNDITASFLAQGEQSGQIIAQSVAQFIDEATVSLDFAFYDFRLNDDLKAIIAAALARRARAGVRIRIAYDADKPEEPNFESGQDPAPGGTGRFVQSLGYPWQRIGGMKLMHHKYIIRDAMTENACIWTGSTNFTDDAWTLQENNIIRLASPELATYYSEDFNQLWAKGTIGNSGSFDTRKINLLHQGERAEVRLLFSPGRGPAIDYEVAHHVAQARHRVLICSMLLNSGALLAALSDQLRIGRVSVSGLYDRSQMESVLIQWQDVPHNHWKIGAIRDIIADAHLVGKNSTPYRPDNPHDFMHNKILVVDDTVITGSYNFSHSAELNAENILMIENAALAAEYSRYIRHLMAKYS